MPSKELLTALSEPFDPADVKQRSAGGGRMLDYISIDKTIQRLNDVLGAGWSFSVIDWRIDESPNGVMACVHGRIDASATLGKSADGLGASMQRDPDDAIKTALAEALKKAGHQLGIALYLWDEAARAKVEEFRKESKTDSTESGLGKTGF